MKAVIKSMFLLFLLLPIACTTTNNKPAVSDEKKATTHYNLGLAKFQSGDLGVARRELEIAIKYAPKIAFYHNHLGLIYMSMGNTKKAEETFRKSYEIDNTYVDSLNNLGVLLMKRGELQEAKKLFAKVLEDSIYPWPQNPEINLGIIARMEKRYEESEKHFTTALHLKRESCYARKELGKLYDDQRITEKAAFNYTLSLKQCPYDVETLYRSAVDYMILRREKEGRDSLKRCMLIAEKRDDPSKVPFLEDCIRMAQQYGVTGSPAVQKKQLK